MDSSALIKRVVEETESNALDAALERYISEDAVIVSSSLAIIEVSRALRSLLDSGGYEEHDVIDAIDVALSGVAERPITEDVVSLARRIAPPTLRTLDAIHLATALLLDVDLIVTYDDRLSGACRHHGLASAAPGK
jgi:uncharacterized protein